MSVCQTASWARFAWRVIKNRDSQTTQSGTTWVLDEIQVAFSAQIECRTQHAQLEQKSYEIIPNPIHLALFFFADKYGKQSATNYG